MKPRDSERGFSLIELMIAMVLGLLVIGAVGTVFLSAQQSYRTKAQFEEAQDAFRFSSHVINRLVQSSENIIQPTSSSTELRIRLLGGPGIFDCLGTPVPSGALIDNTLFLDPDGALQCNRNVVVCASGVCTTGVLVGTGTLVSGISDFAFLYTDLPDNQAPLASNFVTPGTGFSWNNARAVRTTIVMNSGFQASFTSTSRGVTIGNSIIVTQ